tara:strand:+ start:1063 stop:1242 length:180 start_codon:yes stop_codon:yes gene_type:complete
MKKKIKKLIKKYPNDSELGSKVREMFIYAEKKVISKSYNIPISYIYVDKLQSRVEYSRV